MEKRFSLKVEAHRCARSRPTAGGGGAWAGPAPRMAETAAPSALMAEISKKSAPRTHDN